MNHRDIWLIPEFPARSEPAAGETTRVKIAALGVDDAPISIVTRGQVHYTKPDPDLFLTAATSLNISMGSFVVAGDAVWDILVAAGARFWRRCRCVPSGYYGRKGLEWAGAMRVYKNPAVLLRHSDEVSIRR